MIRKISIVILVFLSSIAISAQTTINGIVKDTKEPLPFANVVLHNISDSIFIKGTATDIDGRFTINLDADSIFNYFIRVSSIGYETKSIQIDKPDIGVIMLNEVSNLLSDIVITTTRPVYKMNSNELQVEIKNTILSKLGNGNDVLSQLPFLKENNGKYTVFGRGTPLIYINNRLIRDNDELKQLKSSDIKDVKIILNPGSQYDASIGSVIRINTINPAGEGVSGSLSVFLRKRRNFDHYEYIDLNYRKGKLDLFGKINYYNIVYEQNQKDETILNLDNKYITKDNKKMESKYDSWQITTGANYSFSPIHLMGLRYVYLFSPIGNWDFRGKTSHYVNSINDNNYTSINLTDRKTNRHYLNTYYHNELKNKTIIHFEGDFIKGGSVTDQSSDYKNITNNEDILVKNNSETDYSLYAGKFIVEKPLVGGKLIFGGESSYTENNQSYVMLNKDISEDLPSNKDMSEQFLIVGFTSFDYTWSKYSFNTGLRYEHIDFKYFYNNALSKDQSRVFNNWLPTFSFSYRNENLNMTLGYKTIVSRPNYFNLRSSITYNSPYAYERGNPSLRPMFTNKLSYTLGWKSLQLEVSYNWIKDNLLFVGEQFNDKPISLFTMINLPYSERLDTYISYSPIIKFWRPTFAVGFYKQSLSLGGNTYNNPYYTYLWNNIFQLPRDFLLTLNMRGSFQGNIDVSVYKPTFRTDIRLNKHFYGDKLNIVLSVTDIFSTDLERWSMNTGAVYYNKRNDSDNRGVSLLLTYKFNSARTKYKGQGASTEINRL